MRMPSPFTQHPRRGYPARRARRVGTDPQSSFKYLHTRPLREPSRYNSFKEPSPLPSPYAQGEGDRLGIARRMERAAPDSLGSLLQHRRMC
jgi:hypothetical protein